MLATTLKKRLLGAFLALVALSSVGLVSYWQGEKQGINKGIDMYHQMCFYVGGLVVDSDGKLVLCAPAGVMSKKELDTEMKARYNE